MNSENKRRCSAASFAGGTGVHHAAPATPREAAERTAASRAANPGTATAPDERTAAAIPAILEAARSPGGGLKYGISDKFRCFALARFTAPARGLYVCSSGNAGGLLPAVTGVGYRSHNGISMAAREKHMQQVPTLIFTMFIFFTFYEQ